MKRDFCLIVAFLLSSGLLAQENGTTDNPEVPKVEELNQELEEVSFSENEDPLSEDEELDETANEVTDDLVETEEDPLEETSEEDQQT